MEVYRPMRGGLFFYETVRFAALVSLSLVLGLPGDEGTFPYLAYMTPNALFFMMALFVWIQPVKYRTYIPLYAAGKIMVVMAFIGWSIFSFKSLVQLVPLMRVESLAALGGSFLFSAGDVFAFAVSLVLMYRTNREESSDSQQAVVAGESADPKPPVPTGGI